MNQNSHRFIKMESTILGLALTEKLYALRLYHTFLLHPVWFSGVRFPNNPRSTKGQCQTVSPCAPNRVKARHVMPFLWDITLKNSFPTLKSWALIPVVGFSLSSHGYIIQSPELKCFNLGQSGNSSEELVRFFNYHIKQSN